MWEKSRGGQREKNQRGGYCRRRERERLHPSKQRHHTSDAEDGEDAEFMRFEAIANEAMDYALEMGGGSCREGLARRKTDMRKTIDELRQISGHEGDFRARAMRLLSQADRGKASHRLLLQMKDTIWEAR